MTNIPATPRKRGRPAKAAGDHRETRETLCRAGVAALTEKGFSVTGIDEILKSVGVPKGSFYHFFASKEAFGSELITLYATYFVRKIDRFLLDQSLTPLQRIAAFCEDAEIGMQSFDFHRGCLVGNLGQEMGALPESFRGQLSGVLLDWQARFERCLEEAKAAGEIDRDADCARLAAFFWIGWEGAVLRAKLEQNGEALRLFADIFLTSLSVSGREHSNHG
ncbi:TetR family transcriptional regulator [Pseudomonas sp. C1C7]|uniref:acrylate utilization transcriptional regulator AcuR n=1 Tax=Pseudomonas sp. C1C7 TaxID=2735272 RepID=UPI001585FF19|nr:TetR/AcrR family transcriptional regulator [Pseudomonas sp. C1C7]NUT74838.1 TetR family transcriptional regulator [Pseudomonas sp. C1C7]